MDTEARKSGTKRKGFVGRARSFFGSLFTCTKTPLVHEGTPLEDEAFGPRKSNVMGALPPIQDIEVDDPSQHRDSFNPSEEDFNNHEARGHEKPREKEEEGGDSMVPASGQLHLEKAGSKREITEEITMVPKEA